MKELKDTIDLMTSADYKDRFRAEYWQTKIRCDKLEAMVKKYRAGTLDFKPDCPLHVLEAQLNNMQLYLSFLELRARRYENVDLEQPAKVEMKVEKEEAVLPGLVLNKQDLNFIISALIYYEWKMQDQGRDLKPGSGYKERVLLRAKLREFEAQVFPDRTCCG